MKRRKVLWARSAHRDLEAIAAYLASRSPQAAISTVDRLGARARALTTLAGRGRVVPELGRLHIRHYRELVVAPYRILYRVSEAVVLVVAVIDGRRSLEDALLDRLIATDDDRLP